MILYKCDQCGETTAGEAPVRLEGYCASTVRSGILLPEIYSKLHFCGTICIVKWMRETVKMMDEAAKEMEERSMTAQSEHIG